MRKINLKNVLVLRYSKLSQAMLCYAMLSYADKPKFCDSLVTGTMQRKKAMSRISMKTGVGTVLRYAVLCHTMLCYAVLRQLD